jgi:hypothetical protein
LPAGFQPVHPGHAQIENNDIRFKAIGLFHGFYAIFRFINNFPVGIAAKQGPEPMPDYGMIIRH